MTQAHDEQERAVVQAEPEVRGATIDSTMTITLRPLQASATVRARARQARPEPQPRRMRNYTIALAQQANLARPSGSRTFCPASPSLLSVKSLACPAMLSPSLVPRSLFPLQPAAAAPHTHMGVVRMRAARTLIRPLIRPPPKLKEPVVSGGNQGISSPWPQRMTSLRPRSRNRSGAVGR